MNASNPIALNLLDAHPANANLMPESLLCKLVEHIRATGHYPPLIARPHPQQRGRFQLLDGHHRVIALRRLGYEHANCDVWDVDDEQALILLLTLNRLHGEDDPKRRGELLSGLAQSMDVAELARRLPEDAQRITRLIALTQPPPQPHTPRDVSDMPHAVTFFLSGRQRGALFERLQAVHPDRTEALIAILHLD